MRKLEGQQMQWQKNKVHNLHIATKPLNNILIRPGETFSFCKLVGAPITIRGFKEGMELSNGRARAGVGGGICQISNLIYWLALHSPLDIVERHHHSFDPFPDKGRVLPYASGATVMFNYLNLRIKNNTPYTFQLRFWFDAKCLNGEFRCTHNLPHTYSIQERKHQFFQKNTQWFRTNELWRRVIDKKTGRTLRHEHLVTNCGRVMYTPSEHDINKTSSIVQ